MSKDLKVVDFSALNQTVREEDIDETRLVHISSQLIDEFSSTGIVYLSNTGVPDELITRVFKVAKEFFELSVEEKTRYRIEGNEYQGWSAPELLSFDKNLPRDLVESFLAILLYSDSEKWPSAKVKGFRETLIEFFETCSRLAERLLLALAVGLKLDDRQFFIKRHHFMAKTFFPVGTIRLNYYPPTNVKEMKKGQTRFGEHTDFPTFAFLFQDDVGGLEVQNKTTGVWQDVPPIPGTVVVNIADLLQRWTSDRLVSPMHRVRPPRDEFEQKTLRQSLVFFVHPDEDVVVECLDGSDKYKPVSASEYINQRMIDMYK